MPDIRKQRAMSAEDDAPAEAPEPVETEPEADADDDASGTATAEAPARKAAKPRRRPKPDRGPVSELPKWALILHNDDVNGMDDVIEALTRGTPLSLEVAIAKMIEAHTRGRATLLETHRERAELFRENLAGDNLTASIRRVS